MHWRGELSERLQDQRDLDLEMHNRKAKLLVFHAAVHLRGGSQPAKKFPSKSCPLRYGREKILADVRSLFERGLRDFCPLNKSLSPVKGSGSNSCNWAVTLISIGANDISALPSGVSPITSFFAAPTRSNPPEPREEDELGASSRTPSSNDLESLINNEGALQPCISESLFPADDDTGSDADDVKCTPAFGSVRSPVRHQSHFQVPESETSVQNRCSRDEDLEPSLIRCSPISERETSSAASLHSIQESPTSDATTSETKPKEPANLISPVHESRHHHDPDPGTSSFVNLQSLQDSPRSAEVASRVVQLRLAFPPSKDGQTPPTSSGTRPASSSGLKLKDLWQRKRTASSSSSLEWAYKQEDVDEEVLAQLPPEIQQELRSSLKLQRPPKRPSISDFFQSAAK